MRSDLVRALDGMQGLLQPGDGLAEQVAVATAEAPAEGSLDMLGEPTEGEGRWRRCEKSVKTAWEGLSR